MNSGSLVKDNTVTPALGLGLGAGYLLNNKCMLLEKEVILGKKQDIGNNGLFFDERED